MDRLVANLRIVPYCCDRIIDPRSAMGPLPWQEYQIARNSLVRVCRRHGSVGPMGICAISDRSEPDGLQWELGDTNPLYFVVDDQLNDERYLHVEVRDGAGISIEWLGDVLAALSTMPYWAIAITNIRLGYMLIFPTMLLVSGPAFSGADIMTTLRECRDNLI